jgi:hypothetical protein
MQHLPSARLHRHQPNLHIALALPLRLLRLLRPSASPADVRSRAPVRAPSWLLHYAHQAAGQALAAPLGGCQGGVELGGGGGGSS